jgi:thioesterase domain-containing protein
VALLVAVDDGPQKSVSKFIHYFEMVRKFPKAIFSKTWTKPNIGSAIGKLHPKSIMKHPADRLIEDFSIFPDYHKEFIRRLYDACIDYAPAEKYRGQVLVCSAAQQPLMRPRPVKQMWRNIVAKPGVTSVILPGTHTTLMQPPHVHALARHMLARIEMTSPRNDRPLAATKARPELLRAEVP